MTGKSPKSLNPGSDNRKPEKTRTFLLVAIEETTGNNQK